MKTLNENCKTRFTEIDSQHQAGSEKEELGSCATGKEFDWEKNKGNRLNLSCQKINLKRHRFESKMYFFSHFFA